MPFCKMCHSKASLVNCDVLSARVGNLFAVYFLVILLKFALFSQKKPLNNHNKEENLSRLLYPPTMSMNFSFFIYLSKERSFFAGLIHVFCFKPCIAVVAAKNPFTSNLGKLSFSHDLLL